MPKLQRNGFALHYQVMGNGPSVVLLHGLTGNLAFWYPTIVMRLIADHEVILVDLRGHGYSGMPPTGYTTADMADDLEVLLDHLGVERAHLIGHSYGGAVALNCAVQSPQRVLSVTMADSRIRSLQPARGVRDSVHWLMLRDKLAELGISLDEENEDLDFILLEQLARCRIEGLFENFAPPPFYVPFLSGNNRPAELWLRLVRETTAIEDFKAVSDLTTEAIRTVSQPVLAIYGGLSHCLPTQHALTGMLSDCTATIIEGVGHFHPLIRPETFLEHVCLFLARINVQTAAELSPERDLYPLPGRPESRSALNNPVN